MNVVGTTNKEWGGDVPNWIEIKNEYISTGISYRKLADKHGVTFAALRHRAKQESWTGLKAQQQHKISTKLAQKTQDAIVSKEVNRIERLYDLSDMLSEKIERAISELDIATVTSKHKTRTIEYKDNGAPGKPTKEVIDETEEILQVASIVDRLGLKQLTGALKDIKDIQTALDAIGSVKDGTILENMINLIDLIRSPTANREIPDDE